MYDSREAMGVAEGLRPYEEERREDKIYIHKSMLYCKQTGSNITFSKVIEEDVIT